MTTYIVIGSVILLLSMILASKGLIPKTKQQDSALRQRAIFNVNEQLTYTRLKEILPHHTILAHVSYDALLTTKFSRTRSKYRNLVADFVVVDAMQQVVAVVALDDPLSLKRPQKSDFRMRYSIWRAIKSSAMKKYLNIISYVKIFMEMSISQHV